MPKDVCRVVRVKQIDDIDIEILLQPQYVRFGSVKYLYQFYLRETYLYDRRISHDAAQLVLLQLSSQL